MGFLLEKLIYWEYCALGNHKAFSTLTSGVTFTALGPHATHLHVSRWKMLSNTRALIPATPEQTLNTHTSSSVPSHAVPTFPLDRAPWNSCSISCIPNTNHTTKCYQCCASDSNRNLRKTPRVRVTPNLQQDEACRKTWLWLNYLKFY